MAEKTKKILQVHLWRGLAKNMATCGFTVTEMTTMRNEDSNSVSANNIILAFMSQGQSYEQSPERISAKQP